MSETITRDEFAGKLNTKFKIEFEPGTAFDFELIEVTPAQVRNRYESFALLFQAPPEAPALQQNFAAEHPDLGVLTLFLVPVGQNENGFQFEAVFNRLAAEAPTG